MIEPCVSFYYSLLHRKYLLYFPPECDVQETADCRSKREGNVSQYRPGNIPATQLTVEIFYLTSLLTEYQQYKRFSYHFWYAKNATKLYKY